MKFREVSDEFICFPGSNGGVCDACYRPVQKVPSFRLSVRVKLKYVEL